MQRIFQLLILATASILLSQAADILRISKGGSARTRSWLRRNATTTTTTRPRTTTGKSAILSSATLLRANSSAVPKPQATYFFTNIGPNSFEYRGMFSGKTAFDVSKHFAEFFDHIPNFNDHKGRAFQLLQPRSGPDATPPPPILLQFHPPPPPPPPPPATVTPPQTIQYDFFRLSPNPNPPPPPPPPVNRYGYEGPPPPPPPLPFNNIIQPEKPTLVDYNLQPEKPPILDFNIFQPDLQNYHIVRGKARAESYPKIFKFVDGRINIVDFEKKKKSRTEYHRKGDGLDPDKVLRNKFLILHGGMYDRNQELLNGYGGSRGRGYFGNDIAKLKYNPDFSDYYYRT